jgi:flavin reductase (DIM6/NTAB) family NADH-FMN oxidoreductase RutF
MLSATIHRLELAQSPRAGLTQATGTSFREAMRQVACGVSVITLGAGEDRAGLTATSVSPLSAEPPALLVCVDRGSLSYPALTRLGDFAVNVLAADQRDVAELFAGGSALCGPERFRAGRWLTLPSGVSLWRIRSPCSNAQSTTSLNGASMRLSSAACGECTQAAVREFSSPGAVRMTRSAGAMRLLARSGSLRAAASRPAPPPAFAPRRRRVARGCPERISAVPIFGDLISCRRRPHRNEPRA